MKWRQTRVNFFPDPIRKILDYLRRVLQSLVQTQGVNHSKLCKHHLASSNFGFSDKLDLLLLHKKQWKFSPGKIRPVVFFYVSISVSL
jgi:hypothetical protein